MPPSLAQRAGVLVRGPGTETSDSIPAALSDGELVIPARAVRAFGARQIMAMVDQGGQGLPQPAIHDGVQHASTGGLIEDPANVTRVGNSYSGPAGITGNIAVNGQAPGFGLVSAQNNQAAQALADRSTAAARLGAFPQTPAPAPQPGLGIGQPGAAPQVPGLSVISAPPPSQNVRSVFGDPGASGAGQGMATGGQMSWTSRRPDPTQALAGALSALASRPPAAPAPAPAAIPTQQSSADRTQLAGFADGGLVDADEIRRLAAQQAAAQQGAQVIGRGGERFMGQAVEVPRAALPPASQPVAPGGGSNVPAPRMGLAQQAMAAGPRTIDMGMVEEVPRQRIAAPPGAPAAPGLGLPTAASAAARMAGRAGAAAGVIGEGLQVADVATNPNSTGLDVAGQVATGAGRLASAGLGAKAGAALGALTGPLAPVAVPLGAIAGGAGGYWAADKAIQGGRSLVSMATEGGGQTRAPNEPGAPGNQQPVQGLAARAMAEGAGAGRGSVNPPMADPNALPSTMQPPTNSQAPLQTVASTTSADNVASMNRAADQSRALSQLALEQTQRGLDGPTPGFGVFVDQAAVDRQKFFDSADLRTARARGSWSPRGGFRADEAAIQAAALPLVQRAQEQEAMRREAGALQRTQLQERGLNARERLAATQRNETNDIARARLGLEANREDRALTASMEEQTRKRRIAELDEQIVNGTPAERRAAASAKAAIMGRGNEEVTKAGEVATSMRKEFESLPESKAYKQALPAYRAIQDGVRRSSPQADISMVYAIAKMYDPESVVREGEYATVANAPAMPERIKGWVSYVQGGGKLTPETKRQILTEATSRMESFDNQYGAAIARYDDIARRSGADPTLVIPQGYQSLKQEREAEAGRASELQRRAASDPALAAQLKALGY